MSNALKNILIFGTYQNSILMIDHRQMKTPISIGEQTGGVTQLIQNGIYLLSGSRKDTVIYMWVTFINRI